MTRDRSSHPRSRGRVAQPVPLSSRAVGLDQLASCPEWLWRVRSGGSRHSERCKLYRRARRPRRPGRASSRPEGTSKLNACWCIPLPRRRAGLRLSNGAFADQLDRNQGNSPLASSTWRAGGATPVKPKHLGARVKSAGGAGLWGIPSRRRSSVRLNPGFRSPGCGRCCQMLIALAFM
jgi:hypothetical protein